MDFQLSEWLNLIVRWIHVFAGILWIGQTYYFTWLDHRLSTALAEAGENPGGKVWMVHSGGFYVVEKKQMLEVLPRKLWWFRWEAMTTWVTGMILLVIVYYMGGVLVDDSVANISVGAGVAIGLGLLILSWTVYDLLDSSPLGRSQIAFAVISYLLTTAVAYGLSRTLSGRAAYIHVGSMFGTIMAANVWMRILPGQRKMIAAMQQGRKPDAALAERAKRRSKQNTYMVVPLVFIMLSNHFPSTYGSRYNWAILAVIILVGWGAAKILRNA